METEGLGWLPAVETGGFWIGGSWVSSLILELPSSLSLIVVWVSSLRESERDYVLVVLVF